MTLINRMWWDHLVPKEMAPLRGHLQAMLASFSKTEYGAQWTKTAFKPNGVIRLVPGQIIPVFHVIFLDGSAPFVAPQKKIGPQHRAVSRDIAFQSGHPAQDGEIAIGPSIQVEVVSDPTFLAAARARKTEIDESTVSKPAMIFSCPAHMLFKPQGYPKKSYVLYQHIFGGGGSYPDQGWFYVGVTTRSWQKRWAEHRRNIDQGSLLLFHRRFREERDAGRLTYIHHKVMAATDDVEALYEAEEFMVDGHWDDQRRLNMIPGGKSGLRYMREHGLLSKNVVPMPDERDRVVLKWLQEHPRKGLPAPWVAEKWRDDAWAIAQICGRDGRLSIKQVQAIRTLAETHSAEEIAARIGAKNTAQVERVLAGKTYTRVQ